MNLSRLGVIIYAILVLVILIGVESSRSVRACGKTLVTLLKRACELDVPAASEVDAILHYRQTGDGVVDECCLNRCSYSTLVSYCSTSSEPDADDDKPVDNSSSFNTKEKLWNNGEQTSKETEPKRRRHQNPRRVGVVRVASTSDFLDEAVKL